MSKESEDLKAENRALKSQCRMYEKFVEKCRSELMDQKRQAEKWRHMAEESASKLIEGQAKLEEKNYSINVLHDLATLALRTARLENEEAEVLEQKSLKGVTVANANKKLLRETTEEYLPHYKYLVEKYIDDGKKEKLAKQIARRFVADLVEEKIGDRPSKQLVYKIFPAKEIL